ncbi:MAG: murein biosynthesis integral membrane protein MurJ [Anaerovoracaceae bacterium]|nr:murein biosynthesis integral membrane protein MurJ [Bacillota bacterium]MDY3953956.1 murein biosynthesis integral membrane protein MurJ [Anaerovoracaceae bacterium]
MERVARTALFMAVLTLLSKVLGFVREMVLAGYFGVGDITDAYFMATNIPTMIFGGVFSAVALAYMPTFSKKIELEGEESARRFTREVLSLMLIISGCSMLIGFFLSKPIVSLCAPGYSGFVKDLTVFYVKVTFTYILFISLSALMEAFLQYKKVFLPQIIIGYLQSAGVIIFIILAAKYSYYLLAFGLLAGYGMKAMATAVLAKHKGFPFKPAAHPGNSAKEIMVLALPVFIGSCANQINLFVDKNLASGLSEGCVTALSYGNTIVNTIIGLTTAIVVTMIYPRLTQANSLLEYDHFSDMVSKGLNVTLLIALPCSLGALLYSEPIIRIIYERGAFNEAATSLTAPAFFYYSLGLVFIALTNYLTRAYYAMHDMKTPVVYAILGVIVNIGCNLLFIGWLGHRGLALATSIAALVNTLLLWGNFHRKYPQISLVRSKMKIVWIVISAAVAVGISWPVYCLTSGLPLILNLGAAVAAAGAAYLIVLKLFKIDEVELVIGIVRRKGDK